MNTDTAGAAKPSPSEWIESAMRAWAPLVAFGYECPAASTAMIAAAAELASQRKTIEALKEITHAAATVIERAGYPDTAKQVRIEIAALVDVKKEGE